MSAELRRNPAAVKLFRVAKRLTESQVQRSILSYLRRILPEAIVFHCPNGGSRRSAIEGANLKRLGVSAGVPDLICILPAGKTLFFEVKTEGGKTSPAQAEFHAALNYLGHTIAIVRSIDDAREILTQNNIEMRSA